VVPASANPPPTNLSGGVHGELVWRLSERVELVPGARFDVYASSRPREAPSTGDQRSLVSTIDWLGLIGIVGLPSAVVPIGRTAAGLPVGMQIVAPYLHDRRAVRAAQMVAEALGGYEPPPGF
jgi:amidase